MKRRKSVVRSVAALSAGGLALVWTASPASALESYERRVSFDHTFTNIYGQQVTCEVEGRSSLDRQDDEPYRAFAETSVARLDEFEERCNGLVSVSVDFRDDRQQEREGSASGINLVSWRYDGVDDRFVAKHNISFYECEANCFVSFTTRPK